jgi:hypothetical protein
MYESLELGTGFSAILARVDIRVDQTEMASGRVPQVLGNVGGREGIRTPDPLLAKQVLSQLSYTPILATQLF